ncbi:DUF1778 domain-containing protein [Deinococcus sp.]|uniref:type II toxin-antitoxin system TacA family antitoxin n=1 Tax=Deinococcus sp. TaxID=47478 RepID=UPI0025ED57D9|nr:DUF1778 domain-containing protein [Deinococcus sp.]
MTTAPKAQRLEARIDSDTKDLIAQAAEVRGLSLTDFVVQAAYSSALSTLEAQRLWQLSQRDQQLFVETLMMAAVPNEALLEAARLSRARFGP